MSKIVICGLNGSGKTTLGKLLAAKTNYLHKDIEEYYFDDDSNYKYNKAKSKDKQTVIKLKKILKNIIILFLLLVKETMAL